LVTERGLSVNKIRNIKKGKRIAWYGMRNQARLARFPCCARPRKLCLKGRFQDKHKHELRRPSLTRPAIHRLLFYFSFCLSYKSYCGVQYVQSYLHSRIDQASLIDVLTTYDSLFCFLLHKKTSFFLLLLFV
jgi:hypothetical protein